MKTGIFMDRTVNINSLMLAEVYDFAGADVPLAGVLLLITPMSPLQR